MHVSKSFLNLIGRTTFSNKSQQIQNNRFLSLKFRNNAIKSKAAVISLPLKNSKREYFKTTCYHKSHSTFNPTTALLQTGLNVDRATELIINLKDSERNAIKVALERYDAMKTKEQFEGKLAATQWRTRFGRLSRVPTWGEVDPTGSYCTLSAEWLQKRAEVNAKEPTTKDLRIIFYVNAVPFIAFGFLDNFIMIVAGDYIESLFGVMMGLSTMAAAGLGNTVSDVMGIGSAHYVEQGCDAMGLRPPDLTPVQMNLKKVRLNANYGRIVGIVIGCLLGMTPLLFLNSKKNDNDDDDDED